MSNHLKEFGKDFADTLLSVFKSLMELKENSAALVLVSGKRNFQHAIQKELLALQPVDEGYRTQQFLGLKVGSLAFAQKLAEFAKHRPGDLDMHGRPTDGAICVTKSGWVVAAGVKLFVSKRSDWRLDSAGMRHTTAIDAKAILGESQHMRQRREQHLGRKGIINHCDAAFVLSESGIVTCFLDQEHLAFRCEKKQHRTCVDCHQSSTLSFQ